MLLAEFARPNAHPMVAAGRRWQRVGLARILVWFNLVQIFLWILHGAAVCALGRQLEFLRVVRLEFVVLRRGLAAERAQDAGQRHPRQSPHRATAPHVQSPRTTLLGRAGTIRSRRILSSAKSNPQSLWITQIQILVLRNPRNLRNISHFLTLANRSATAFQFTTFHQAST